jgi:hypothetical protein
MKAKEKHTFWGEIGDMVYTIFLIVKFILTIPFYIIKGIVYLVNKEETHLGEVSVKRARESIKPIYKSFKVITKLKGNYASWENIVLKSDSKIGIIVGARGSGKTAFGIKLLENVYAKKKRACYAIGFNPSTLPSWITVVSAPDEIPNNAFVLIDEGGILFSSRRAMSNPNKLLGDLLLISRHKNLSILFIAQNSSNLDVNIIRQADYLVLKPSALLQKNFERKIIQEIYTSVEKEYESLKGTKGITYLYSDPFQGFVTNELPSFWSTNLSKSFKDKK